MMDRFVNNLSTDFRIFTDKTILPINAFKPTREAKEEVARIFQRHARDNGSKMTFEEAMNVADYTRKNATLNPITKTPEFPFAPQSVLDDVGVHKKNIADNKINPKSLY